MPLPTIEVPKYKLKIPSSVYKYELKRLLIQVFPLLGYDAIQIIINNFYLNIV